MAAGLGIPGQSHEQRRVPACRPSAASRAGSRRPGPRGRHVRARSASGMWSSSPSETPPEERITSRVARGTPDRLADRRRDRPAECPRSVTRPMGLPAKRAQHHAIGRCRSGPCSKRPARSTSSSPVETVSKGRAGGGGRATSAKPQPASRAKRYGAGPPASSTGAHGAQLLALPAGCWRLLSGRDRRRDRCRP